MQPDAVQRQNEPFECRFILLGALSLGLALLAAATATGQDGPRVVKHVEVYNEPGRFAGWPANNGIWSWDDEIVVGTLITRAGAVVHPTLKAEQDD